MKKATIISALGASLLLTFVGGSAVSCSSSGKAQKGNVLVAYFSATGTTKAAAELVAKASGGTLFEIAPTEKYTEKDLDWRDQTSRSTLEMADPSSRPEIASKVEDFDKYDTVFIGCPVWWNLAPHIINTFIESYDFKGKTVVLFCTSGSSGMSNTEKELHKAYPTLSWKEGKLLNEVSGEDVAAWVKNLL